MTRSQNGYMRIARGRSGEGAGRGHHQDLHGDGPALQVRPSSGFFFGFGARNFLINTCAPAVRFVAVPGTVWVTLAPAVETVSGLPVRHLQASSSRG